MAEQKTILDLKGYRFFVPSYQRGYRWTEHEVKALLDDVNEFSSEGDKQYCLQPLIVKKRDDGSFEVVDGQQRLTTIYIFMQYVKKEILSATPPFDLEYETRKDSAKFLQELSDAKASNKDENDKNIDFSHMAKAYETIKEWFENQKDKSSAISKLNLKIRENVFFIWHEIGENDDPISMFTKVNLGKIPLTNAELIKALLLNKDNFNNYAKDEDKRQKQLEISIAWDAIEQRLRDDSFWYFLNNFNEGDSDGTRIDMLFKFLAEEKNKEPVGPLIDKKQKYFPFLVFAKLLKDASDKEKFVKDIWDRVKKLYADFREWYSDLDKYHIIGYLIASGSTIKKIHEITDKERKNVSEIKLRIEAKPDDDDNWMDFEYDKKKEIKNLLLLFNIASLICKGEKQYRFPFDIYKKEKWDIDHIHASADESGEKDDSLGNLTLLNAETNRSCQDKPFNEKRKTVFEKDEKGFFIPLCTRNVFLKRYSKNPNNMNIWDEGDKKDYLKKMKKIFDEFSKEEK